MPCALRLGRVRTVRAAADPERFPDHPMDLGCECYFTVRDAARAQSRPGWSKTWALSIALYYAIFLPRQPEGPPAPIRALRGEAEAASSTLRRKPEDLRPLWLSLTYPRPHSIGAHNLGTVFSPSSLSIHWVPSQGSPTFGTSGKYQPGKFLLPDKHGELHFHFEACDD